MKACALFRNLIFIFGPVIAQSALAADDCVGLPGLEKVRITLSGEIHDTPSSDAYMQTQLARASRGEATLLSEGTFADRQDLFERWLAELKLGSRARAHIFPSELQLPYAVGMLAYLKQMMPALPNGEAHRTFGYLLVTNHAAQRAYESLRKNHPTFFTDLKLGENLGSAMDGWIVKTESGLPVTASEAYPILQRISVSQLQGIILALIQEFKTLIGTEPYKSVADLQPGLGKALEKVSHAEYPAGTMEIITVDWRNHVMFNQLCKAIARNKTGEFVMIVGQIHLPGLQKLIQESALAKTHVETVKIGSP